ncbi:MAG: hypothetical protein KIT58_01850 [Planctomycetota bacterium]|nr:hypothetical protein [Planctomycetota bacterium]
MPIELRTGRGVRGQLGLVREVDPGGPRGPRLLRPAADTGEFLDRPLRDRWRAVVEHLLAEERPDWLGGVLDALAARMGGWPVTRERTALAAGPILALEPGRWVELRALLEEPRARAEPLYQLFVTRQQRRGVDLPDWRPLTRRSSATRSTSPTCATRSPPTGPTPAPSSGCWRAWPSSAAWSWATSSPARRWRSPVGRHYLEPGSASPAIDLADDPPGKVVVQPNLEVLVLGRAPAPAPAALATPRPGESGPARTYVLSKDRSDRPRGLGAAPRRRPARAGRGRPRRRGPLNVARTVQDWARAVRRARVAYVPVLLTDDEETALTIRSLAGKDVLLPGHAVPVNPAKLSAFKRALRAKGVVLDEDEPPASGRRRGRR